MSHFVQEVPRASHLTVKPDSVDDWEAVELNQDEIAEGLLSQVTILQNQALLALTSLTNCVEKQSGASGGTWFEQSHSCKQRYVAKPGPGASEWRNVEQLYIGPNVVLDTGCSAGVGQEIPVLVGKQPALIAGGRRC